MVTQVNDKVTNNKILLVIDWSNIMFRSLFMHQLFNRSIAGDYERIEDLQSFTYKFAVDVCALINMFKPQGVLLATDSQHAWRKDVDPDYKGTREKDPKVKWENIYKCSDDLQSILEKRGIHVGKVEHGEADDVIAMTKEIVFEKYQDYSIIVVSADADIRQLIEFNNDTKQFCVVYNTTTGKGKNGTRRMYMTQEFKNWIDSPDVCDIFFRGYEPSKHYIKELLQMNSVIEPYVEEPNSVVLGKILCGDDGDNVKAFYSFYKNGRLVRITPKKAEKILMLTEADTVQKLCNKVGMLKEVFEKVCKHEIDDCDFEKQLFKQRTMVELNSSLFPEDIQKYKDTIDYMMRHNVGNTFQEMKAQDILAGSAYENGNNKRALSASVFNDIREREIKHGFVPIDNTVQRSAENVQQRNNISETLNTILNPLF